MRFIGARIAASSALLIMLLSAVFGLSVVLIPGDFATRYRLSMRAEDVELIRAEMGPDQLWWIQLGRWLSRIVRGDHHRQLRAHIPHHRRPDTVERPHVHRHGTIPPHTRHVPHRHRPEPLGNSEIPRRRKPPRNAVLRHHSSPHTTGHAYVGRERQHAEPSKI